MVVGGEVQRKEKKHSGRPRAYPSGRAGDVDEAVRAKHSSKQLRGQLRGVARGGGSARRQSTPLPNTVAAPIHPIWSFAKIAQKLN